jgi:hypothetical protein
MILSCVVSTLCCRIVAARLMILSGREGYQVEPRYLCLVCSQCWNVGQRVDDLLRETGRSCFLDQNFIPIFKGKSEIS